MPKIGYIREDGRVYNGKNLCFKGGEYWATMDAFLKARGSSWYEKRAIMDENVKARALEKKEIFKRVQKAKIVREERNRLNSLKPKRRPKKNYATIEEKKEALKEWDKERRATDPAYAKRQKENSLRHYYKINAEKIAKRKEAKQAKANEDEAKRIERNERLIERAKKKEEAALVKSLRPKRVVLTEEQRKEAKRQGKRNYKHVRRARINSCEVKATPKIIEEARKNAGDRCYYCGRKSKLTLDHFDPLAKGGAHCISNLVFACFSCNSRKRDLDPFEFMASNVAISF